MLWWPDIQYHIDDLKHFDATYFFNNILPYLQVKQEYKPLRFRYY
jgi:hypothetical protein